MPTHASGISQPCTYFGRRGPCGAPCYNGTCRTHRNRTSLKACLRCGKGTGSVTGYCPCSYRQISIAHKMKRERLAAEAAAREMDAYIRELFDLPAEGLSP